MPARLSGAPRRKARRGLRDLGRWTWATPRPTGGGDALAKEHPPRCSPGTAAGRVTCCKAGGGTYPTRRASEEDDVLEAAIWEIASAATPRCDQSQSQREACVSTPASPPGPWPPTRECAHLGHHPAGGPDPPRSPSPGESVHAPWGTAPAQGRKKGARKRVRPRLPVQECHPRSLGTSRPRDAT